jgi:hypothetical protein
MRIDLSRLALSWDAVVSCDFAASRYVVQMSLASRRLASSQKRSIDPKGEARQLSEVSAILTRPAA